MDNETDQLGVFSPAPPGMAEGAQLKFEKGQYLRQLESLRRLRANTRERGPAVQQAMAKMEETLINALVDSGLPREFMAPAGARQC